MRNQPKLIEIQLNSSYAHSSRKSFGWVDISFRWKMQIVKRTVQKFHGSTHCLRRPNPEKFH